MTKLLISAAIAAIMLSSCNANGDNSKTNPAKNDSSMTTPKTEIVYACPMHPEVTGKKGEKCSKCGMELVEVKSDPAPTSKVTGIADSKATASIKEIVNDYLQLKDALTKDNSNEAGKAGVALEAAFKNFDKTSLTDQEKKVYEDVEDDAREHAEHIGKSVGNIAHQREHFDLLSNDMYDLVKAFGSEKVLYKDFCPMYNNKKGAFWISDIKEIKNPYYGKAMPNCGSVKEEIK